LPDSNPAQRLVIIASCVLLWAVFLLPYPAPNSPEYYAFKEKAAVLGLPERIGYSHPKSKRRDYKLYLTLRCCIVFQTLAAASKATAREARRWPCLKAIYHNPGATPGIVSGGPI
jgi:hypothetical protein